MMHKETLFSNRDIVIREPQDDPHGSSMNIYVMEPRSSVVPERGSISVPRGKRKSLFKPPSYRRNSIKSQPSIRHVKRRYFGMVNALKTATPQYEGNEQIGYTLLFLHFLRTALDIRWRRCEISTRAWRKIVIVELAIMFFIGCTFIAGGLYKISHRTKNLNDEHTEDFYWAMTIVATLVLTLALTGTVGIFRPNIMVTEIFAVFSFIFGHLIFSIVISWYLLVVLDSYLSTEFDETKILPLSSRYDVATEIYKDEFLQDYFKLLIIVSLVMMSSGVITTKLLIQIRRAQGYINIFLDNTNQ